MPLKLPRLPYEQKRYQPQIVTFGGVNYSQNHRDGELSDCRNLSTREYPCLSQRPGRKTVEGYENVTAVYDYSGKLIVCAGGKLYMDGKEICKVSDEPKQFAVVNTQLVIWPDRIVVSLTEERVLQDCEPVVTADDVSTVYDGSSIAAPVCIPISLLVRSYENASIWNIYTYGNDREKFLACWNAERCEWDGDKLKELEKQKTVAEVSAGDFVIPSTDWEPITDRYVTLPDKSNYATDGKYQMISDINGSTEENGTLSLSFTGYLTGTKNAIFYEHFSVGDRVDVFGGPFGLVGTEHAEIGEVDAAANKLTFSGAEVIRQPVLYCPQELGRVRAGEKVYLFKPYEMNGTTYRMFYEVSAQEDIPEGCIVFGTIDESDPVSTADGYTYDWTPNKVQFWHPDKKEVYRSYKANSIQNENQVPGNYLTMEPYPETYALTITRSLPKLDYICASDNRLWGVSNEDKTIWGSELGLPFNFYTYAGKSTDSYAVPVGSDGDFTGCIGYGGNVLFWKEDKLHKLLGTAPENYQLYEYTVRGLMEGCHKSQVIINETLFFKSRDGVCAYTGSVPSLISENFGVRRFRDATAGTDNEKYYISMRNTRTDAWGLWVFDPATGLWLQEGAERVLDFANLDGTLYLLMDGGQVLMAGQTDSDEVIEWEATFCEMTEQYHERKCYSRLLLRMDMEQGAFCRGEISTDGGPFREVGTVHGARNKTGELLIHPVNCDRFQIRLKGRGRCRLKSLIREFTFGGER